MSTTARTNSRPSSDELLLAAGDGDQDAFAHLFDRLVDPVRMLIQGFVSGLDGVEAATQDVMLEAWRTAPRFDPAEGSASRWVLALARRRAVDREATGRVRRAQAARADRRTTVGTSATGVDVSDAERLLQALAALPAMHRHALQLAFHGRADYLEVARLLETTPATILAAMRSGLRQLRSALLAPDGVVVPPARRSDR